MTETTATKLVRIEDKIDSINEHLDRINGSVARASGWIDQHNKDTSCRQTESATRWSRQGVINAILGVVGAASVVALVTIFISKTYGG